MSSPQHQEGETDMSTATIERPARTRKSRASRAADQMTKDTAKTKTTPASKATTKPAKTTPKTEPKTKTPAGPSNASKTAAQQIIADLAARVTPAQLKRAGLSEAEYVAGVRQVLGYSSHNVEVPARFGARYGTKDGRDHVALWGRPRPEKNEK